MKKEMKKLLFLALVVLSMTLQAQVKIGNNPTTINSSSLLEMESTTKGLLPPRMTSAQMNDIATPATGLHVFCSNCSPAALHFFNGTAWAPVGDTSSGGSSSSGGVSATMAINGTYTWGATHTDRKIIITISNQSFSAVTWTNAIADLELTGNSGLTPGTPTATGFPIASGGTGTITFPVTGIVGTMDEITATWTKLALTVVGTKTVTAGSATFTNATNNAFVFSAKASGVDVAGTISSGTSILLPYTAGVGKYENYVSPEIPIPSQYCNDGASNWTFSYTYPLGTFSSTGNLTAYIYFKKGGVDTPWPAFQVTNIATINFNCVSAPLVVNGATLSNTVGIDEGGDAIRGQLTTRGAAYDAAAVNQWISISAAEYNNLASNVSGAVRKGASDTVLANNHNTITTMTGGTYTSLASGLLTSDQIPPSNYIFAYRLKTSGLETTTMTNCQVKFNATSANGTYTALGNALPVPYTSAIPDDYTNYYYVLKRPTVRTSSTGNTFIAIYDPNRNIGVPTSQNTAFYFVSTNTNNFTNASYTNGTVAHQVLCTPTKSW